MIYSNLSQKKSIAKKNNRLGRVACPRSSGCENKPNWGDRGIVSNNSAREPVILLRNAFLT